MEPSDERVGEPARKAAGDHRVLNLISLAFLVASLISFMLFHVLEDSLTEGKGWRVWLEIWEMIRDPSFFEEPRNMMAAASFFTVTLLITCSPAMVPLFRRSRLLWWLAAVFSGLATITFWLIVLLINDPQTIGLSAWCLLAAPVLNLTGLFLIRGEPRAGLPDP